jgi:hypothetical protein
MIVAIIFELEHVHYTVTFKSFTVAVGCILISRNIITMDSLVRKY